MFLCLLRGFGGCSLPALAYVPLRGDPAVVNHVDLPVLMRRRARVVRQQLQNWNGRCGCRRMGDGGVIVILWVVLFWRWCCCCFMCGWCKHMGRVVLLVF